MVTDNNTFTYVQYNRWELLMPVKNAYIHMARCQSVILVSWTNFLPPAKYTTTHTISHLNISQLTQWSMQWTKSNSSSAHVSVVLLREDTRSLHWSSFSFRLAHFDSSPHFSLSTSWWSTASSSSSCVDNKRHVSPILEYMYHQAVYLNINPFMVDVCNEAS